MEQGNKITSAKSMMGVLSLSVDVRREILLSVNGVDEQEAMQSVATLLQTDRTQEKK